MRKNKKAVLDNIGDIFSTLGYIAILGAIIFVLIAQTRTTVEERNPCNLSNFVYNSTVERCCGTTHNGSDYIRNCTVGGNLTGLSSSLTAVRETQAATSDIPGWYGIIVITLIGGVLLILVRYFRGQK